MRANTADFSQIFLNGLPMMDARAPVEFSKGAFPGVLNLPLMNDLERQQVGTCYKQRGQEAAIKLGHQLVSGAVKTERIAAWAEFARANPDGYLEFGRLAVLPAWSPPCLYDWGTLHSAVDPTQVEYTLGQNPLAIQRLRCRTTQIDFTRVSPTQHENYFRTLFELVGLGNDFLYVHDAQSGREAWTDQYIIYGRLTEWPAYNEYLVGGKLSMKMRQSR